MTVIRGQLARGLGEAAKFTQLDWVRRQLVTATGIDPHPGTVNLTLGDAGDRQRWRAWRELPGLAIDPPDATFCRALCHAVRIDDRIPAAVLIPEIEGYPEDKMELVAALPVCRHLALAEGSSVKVERCRPLVTAAVLFDIDGTLVDSVGAYLEVARIAAQPHGLEVTEFHVRHALATGSSFWRGVVPEDTPVGKAVRKAMALHAAREWPRVLRENGKVFGGLAQTLDAIRQMGIVLGIVSGARPEVLDLLSADAILDRFDAVVLGPDVTRPKPDPEGILKCLRQLGVAPEAAIYVGDAPVDIVASRAAGVRAIGILTGAGDGATLSAQEPDRLVASHAGLPGVLAPV
jgi:HAD superfamily hydrolase (TIGR01509 family)